MSAERNLYHHYIPDWATDRVSSIGVTSCRESMRCWNIWLHDPPQPGHPRLVVGPENVEEALASIGICP